MKHIFVAGKPVPQPRHRFTCVGGYARAYLPPNAPVIPWKNTIAAAVMTAGLSGKLLNQPIKLTAIFYLPIPKSGKSKITESMPHTKKPDLDNLVKALMDTLTDQKVWVDDSLVYALDLKKLNSFTIGVKFCLT